MSGGRSRTLRYLLAFTVAVLVGRISQDAQTGVSLVWPAAGVATLWLAGSRDRWTRVSDATLLVGAAGVVAVATGVEAPQAAVLALATSAGAVAGARGLRDLWSGRFAVFGRIAEAARVGRPSGTTDASPNPAGPSLTTLADGIRLLLCALAAGVGAAAALLVLAASVGPARGLLPLVGLVGVRTTLGALLVLAVVLAVRDHRRARAAHPRLARAVAADVALTVATYAGIFWAGGGLAISYAAVPLTVWVALRSGVLRTTIHVAAAATTVLTLAFLGVGPFALGPAAERSLVAQGIVAVVAIVGLGLALVREERQAAVQAATAAAARLRRTLDSALIAHLTVRVTDGGALVVERANPAAAAFLGRPRDALPGWSWLDAVDPGHHAVVLGAVEALRAGERSEVVAEVLHHLPDGSDRWGRMSAGLMPSAAGQGDAGDPVLAVQLLDVTDRKAAEEQLAFRALHDDLTGCANRVLLTDRLEQALAAALRGGRPVALLFFDLDHFKRVNDTLGHGAGDVVLRVVADRLRAASRATDTVARMGGDEFVVLCPEVGDQEEAREIAARMLAVVGEPVDVRGQTAAVGVSGGVAVSRPDSTAESLLRQADTAMYEAKGHGRGRVETFTDGLAARAYRQAELEHALALAVRQGQFVLHYQPVVDIATGVTVGLEALLRWQHPERGLLLPAEWLDVAEATDTLLEIGPWVLEEACRQAATLVAAGHLLSMHVNVSARQLRTAGLVETVAEVLARTGLNPRHLVVELTETHLLEVHNSLRADLRRLRASGVRIAADDFGTGFSALQQLVQLPIDVLKIDRSFVAVMGRDRRAAAVIDGVIGMARAIGAEVVAEGVEMPEQAAALLRAGCTVGQGYHWARPVPPDELVLREAAVPAQGRRVPVALRH